MNLSFPLSTLLAWVVSIGAFLALAVYIRSAMTKEDKMLVAKTAAGIGLWAIFLYAVWGFAGQSEGSDFHESGLESGEFLIRALGVLAKGL